MLCNLIFYFRLFSLTTYTVNYFTKLCQALLQVIMNCGAVSFFQHLENFLIQVKSNIIVSLFLSFSFHVSLHLFCVFKVILDPK